MKKVAFLVGEVFIGYIKPEQVASELHEVFDIDLQKSNFVEIELKQKIFNPLKSELEKVYNPPTTETQEQPKEAAPTIINFEPSKDAVNNKQGAVSISNIPNIPLQKPSEIITEKKLEVKTSPFIMGGAPIQPLKSTPVPKEEAPMTETPFIIQTKTEAVKPLTPQFPKETPSLNLKVDESLIQKNPTIKPISVHLETESQITSGAKFQMPVTARATIENKQPLPSEKIVSQIPTPTTQKPISQLQEKTIAAKPEQIKVEIPIKKPVSIPTAAAPTPSLKQITEQQNPSIQKKSLYEEQPAKVVHYSAFKTPLTPSGAPKKPEQNKEFINLSTFTKVSGNTVDLRQQDKK